MSPMCSQLWFVAHSTHWFGNQNRCVTTSENIIHYSRRDLNRPKIDFLTTLIEKYNYAYTNKLRVLTLFITKKKTIEFKNCNIRTKIYYVQDISPTTYFLFYFCNFLESSKLLC